MQPVPALRRMVVKPGLRREEKAEPLANREMRQAVESVLAGLAVAICLHARKTHRICQAETATEPSLRQK